MLPNSAVRLIVVDDEPEIRGMVVDYFSRDGYATDGCASGEELDVALAAGPCDLVLLDVAMPGEDGVSIARRLKANGAAGIIMLTGLHDTVDRIVGLEVGADDYVTKPFDLRELRARVRAVLRRSVSAPSGTPAQPVESAAQPPTADQADFGRVRLDLAGRCLVDDRGDSHPLTTMEFDLLVALARSPNRVMSRDRLRALADHRPLEPFDRAIDIRIARLRKKIEADPAKPCVIKTIQGVGYIYVPPSA